MNNLENEIALAQERAENTYIPNTPYTLSDYLYGRCQIFAQALHEELGYEIQCLWDTDYWFDDADSPSTVLAHAYCVLPNGEFMDARGIISKEAVLYDYDCNCPFFGIYSLAKLKEAYNNNILEEPTQKELHAIREFIRTEINTYNFKTFN